MENVLLEKIRNDTVDEIDKKMICARVANAEKAIFDAYDRFSYEIKRLTETFAYELKMSGIGLVLAVSDALIYKGKPCIKVVFGNEKIIMDLLKQ